MTECPVDSDRRRSATQSQAARSPAPPAIHETVDPAVEMARVALRSGAKLDAQALGSALHSVASEIYEELSGEVGADGAAQGL